jgi:hypothetical protein
VKGIDRGLRRYRDPIAGVWDRIPVSTALVLALTLTSMLPFKLVVLVVLVFNTVAFAVAFPSILESLWLTMSRLLSRLAFA